MATQVFRVDRKRECRRAGPTDLIRLLPVPGGHPLFVEKWLVEALVYAIVKREFIHLSGPTGTAKSSLIEALYRVPDNFKSLCKQLGFKRRPLLIFPIEMATYEAPGELYQRRALANGCTFDEVSLLVKALQEAEAVSDSCYPLIWLREMGRVHSSSVQGGLLNLMTKGDIVLPDARRINGLGISWVADSNYQAEHDSTHMLVTLDDALKRRFTVNLTLDYLSAEQEVSVVKCLVEDELSREGRVQTLDAKLIHTVVRLGSIVRRHRAEGNLLSVPPPTIYNYLTLIRMARGLPHLTLQQIAMVTMLGNASVEDRKLIAGVVNEVFGIKASVDDDPTTGGNLF